MYVIIVGGGKVGYYLSKELLKEQHEVLLLEKDKRRLEFLTEELGEVVALGDGCEIRQMETSGFRRADVVVAVTGDDEDNLVICQMAQQQFSVPRTLARVNDPANEPIFHRLGIQETLNSTRLIYNLIEQSIETNEVVPVAALQQGNIEIAEIHIGENTPIVGKRIMDLHLPERALVIAVIRSGEAHIPTFDTRLLVDDTIIVMVHAEQAEALSAVLGG